jgi:hypothetical protein
LYFRSGTPGGLEAQPDLDAFHRRNRHQHAGQPAIQLAIPVGVTAQAQHHAPGDDFHFAAQGVARGFGCVDPLDRHALRQGIEHAHR